MKYLAVWVVIAFGLGCGHQSKKLDPEAGPGRVMSTERADVQDHMQVHDAQGLALRDAVIRGDLQAIHAPAKWMAEHMADQVAPPDWAPHVQDMRTAAQAMASTDSLPDAARFLADMAGACAECHEKLSGPKIFLSEPPAKTTKMPEQMMRHVWATDRLWDGIVAPSEEAWVAGSNVLGDSPLNIEEMTPDQDIHGLAAQLSTFGIAAGRAQTRAARVAVYGELMGTCATCHSALGRGP